MPNAKFLVRNRPRKSKVESTQEIGRLLRPFEGEDPYIVEIEDEFPSGSTKPYTIFDLFEVENIEQGGQMVKPIEVIGPENVDGIEVVIGTPPDTEEPTTGPEGVTDVPPEEKIDVIEPPIKILPPNDEDDEDERERQERYERMTRELLGKMQVEANLVRELRRVEYKKREAAPEGWLTNGALADKLLVDNQTVTRIAERYRADNPAWVKDYLTARGLFPHYHPELVAIITTELSNKIESAPVGWMTKGALTAQLKLSGKNIKKTAETYRQANPTWFKIYLDKGRKKSEHYHPDLILEIIKTLKEGKEEAPSGWLNNNNIATKLKVSQSTITGMAEKYRDHKEWFKNYIDKAKRVSEHFHPDLVAIITQEVSQRGETVPEGWMTRNRLAGVLGIHELTIKKLESKYRQANPQWFKKYLDKSNRQFEYYHPDLIEQITRELKK